MGLIIEGFDRTLYLFAHFQMDIGKKMEANIERVMQPIATKARGFMPRSVPQGLSGWAKPPKVMVEGWRDFPIFDPSEMRAGIRYHAGLQKENRRGFSKAYSVSNESAAGAIYETAGRKHPGGTPNKSRSGVYGPNGTFSPNPGAGEHFINALPEISRASRRIGQKGRSKKTRNGRVIFKAWNADQGKVIGAVNKAIQDAQVEFNNRRTIFKIHT